MTQDRLLDGKMAAEFLGVGRGILFRMARRNEIPSIRVGLTIHFRLSDLLRWLDEHPDSDGAA